MRISDWSSDVCSSDLPPGVHPDVRRYPRPAGGRTLLHARLRVRQPLVMGNVRGQPQDVLIVEGGAHPAHVGQRSEERRVGKEWSVRVDLGGRRIIKKKKDKIKKHQSTE